MTDGICVCEGRVSGARAHVCMCHCVHVNFLGNIYNCITQVYSSA